MARCGVRSVWVFSVLLSVVLVGPLILAGCLGSQDDEPRLQLRLEPLQEPFVPGESASFRLHVDGAGAQVARVGVASADSSTDSVASSLIVEGLFDEVYWTREPATAPAVFDLHLETVPEDPLMWLRGVVETDSGLHWSPEVRVRVQAPEAVPTPRLGLSGVPESTYRYNLHTVRVNVTGVETDATQVGFVWNLASTMNRDPGLLKPGSFDGTLDRSAGSFPLPGVFLFQDWMVPLNTTFYLRAWVSVDGELFWSDETVVRSQDPPPVDTKVSEVDQVVRIEPFLLPLALLDAFKPQEVEIKVGQTLAWVNEADTVHTASHDANETAFHTGSLASGVSSVPFRFLVPGEYPYKCRVHPETMTGTIIVTE